MLGNINNILKALLWILMLLIPILFFCIHIKRKYKAQATRTQKTIGVLGLFATVSVFVAMIVVSGCKTIVYCNDLKTIESLTTKRTGTILNLEDAWPREGTHWGEEWKTKSGFTLSITLEDGKQYGFDVGRSDLMEEIRIGDEVSFYYSEDIYPNTGFNAFGLEKDGKQLSGKASDGLKEALNRSKWYAGFSIFIGLLYGYQCIKQLKLLYTLGWKAYIEVSYSNIKK